MKLKNYLYTFSIRASVFLGFYLWAHGSTGAGNLLQFALWVLSIGVVVVAILVLVSDHPPPPRPASPEWWSYFLRVTGAAIVALLAWFGCAALATAYIIAWISAYVANESLKPRGAAK